MDNVIDGSAAIPSPAPPADAVPAPSVPAPSVPPPSVPAPSVPAPAVVVDTPGPSSPVVIASPAERPIIQDLINSYVYLRRCIGIIGMALPFVLIFGHDIAARSFLWRDSMSSYYYTDMRNIFVGSLWAIGIFLISYRYGRIDNILTNVAGFLAIGVALCPTTSDHPSSRGRIVGYFHFSFAAVLFLLLATFCFYLFTQSDPTQGPPTPRKQARNRVYRTCGTVIVVCVVLAAFFESALVTEGFRDSYDPVIWCESLALMAFGFSWLIKGKTFLQD